MRTGLFSATLVGATLLIGSCVPAGGSFQGGGGGFGTGGGIGTGGGGGGFGPAAQSPFAAGYEIEQYLAGASVYIQYSEAGGWGHECGYFGYDGAYDSFWFEYDTAGYDEFSGGWSVRGDELCINGYWYYSEEPHFGCFPLEWSRGDTLLLISARDEVMAEITAYDGPGAFNDGCGISLLLIRVRARSAFTAPVRPAGPGRTDRMVSGRAAVMAGLAGMLCGCLPQSGAGTGAAGSGGGQSFASSPLASGPEIERFVRDASAFIEHYYRGERTHIECAYFAGNYNFESIVFELDYDSYSWDGKSNFSGAWDTQGDRLCFTGSYYGTTSPWFRPPETEHDFGCYVAEWSADDDALLLIDAYDEVVATIIADDGPGNFERACDL